MKYILRTSPSLLTLRAVHASVNNILGIVPSILILLGKCQFHIHYGHSHEVTNSVDLITYRAVWTVLGLLTEQCGQCLDYLQSSVDSARLLTEQRGQCQPPSDTAAATDGFMQCVW